MEYVFLAAHTLGADAVTSPIETTPPDDSSYGGLGALSFEESAWLDSIVADDIGRGVMWARPELRRGHRVPMYPESRAELLSETAAEIAGDLPMKVRYGETPSTR